MNEPNNKLTIKTADNDCYCVIDVHMKDVTSVGDLYDIIQLPPRHISDEQCDKDGVKPSQLTTIYDDNGNELDRFASISGYETLVVVFSEIYSTTVYYEDYSSMCDKSSIPEYVNNLFIMSGWEQTRAKPYALSQLKVPESLNELYLSGGKTIINRHQINIMAGIKYIKNLTIRDFKFAEEYEIKTSVKKMRISYCEGECLKLPNGIESIVFYNCEFTRGVFTFPHSLQELDIFLSSVIVNENFPETIVRCSIVNNRIKKISTPTGAINNWPENLETLCLDYVCLNIPERFPPKLRILKLNNCQSENTLFPTEWPDTLTEMELKYSEAFGNPYYYTTFPSYWPRNCTTIKLMDMNISGVLPKELPVNLTHFKSTNVDTIPAKWPESLKTLKCNFIYDAKFPDEWSPNIENIKLAIHEHTILPDALPDKLLKFCIKTSNHKHIPNTWPASLTSIIVRSDTFVSASSKLFIHKHVLEKYKEIGIDITPQQFLMIVLDVADPDDTDYFSSGEDNDDDRCRECGRY